MRGKLIVIEGTDCSGKETQTKKLCENLKNKGLKVFSASFPMYETPTGKIVGGPYLGKEHICNGWFPETAANVPAEVASLYYAADRKYNSYIIEKYLEEGYIVILDRYITSNMAHQAGKKETPEEKEKMINFLDKLEYGLLELPKPDITLFLHMPYEAAIPLRANRAEALDQHESSESHLKDAEAIFLYLATRFDFTHIKCAKENVARPIDEISFEVLAEVEKIMNYERRRI